MTDPSTVATPAGPTGTHKPGTFVWHELRTRDVDQAQAFYTALFGWTFTKAGMPDMDYRLIHLGDKKIGGLFNAQGHEMPAHWGGLISVPDVDKAAEAVKAAGGDVCAGPEDIPGVGRFAMLFDPQGASVGVYKTLDGDPDTGMPLDGEFCWDQLNTTDMAGAAAFYQTVVGWTPEPLTPEMGLFKMGDLMEASYGPVPPGVPPHWLTLISVTELAETTKKAESLGATTLMANLDAGGWGRFSVVQDAAGAVVGFFQGNEG